MSKVTVYTKPACGPCLATKRALTASGVEFKEIRLYPVTDATGALLERFRERGLLSAPIVEVEGMDPWSGFQPARISDAVSHLGLD